MATFGELKKLAKEVMAASVDAQLLGLIQVSVYLGMAFEEVVREAARLNTEEGTIEAARDAYVKGVESGGP